MELAVLLALGIAAGTIGALAGLGGGIIIVPSLLFISSSTALLTGITPQTAVGISTLIMIATGLSSTLAYMKKKLSDYKAALLFFAGSGPGGILGALANKHLEADAFSVYFGLFMLVMSLVMMVKSRIQTAEYKPGIRRIETHFTDPEGCSHLYGYNPFPAVALAFGVGFCSGLFGIGGGSLMVPAMMLLFYFPPHAAVATSMFMVFLSAVTNSAMHIYLGNVIWIYAAALIPGAWAGAKLGAMISTRLKSRTLETVLKAVLLIMGIRLIYQGITG